MPPFDLLWTQASNTNADTLLAKRTPKCSMNIAGNETLCSILPFTAQGVPILLYHYKRFKPSEYEATTHAAAIYDIAMIERAIALSPPDGPNRIIVAHDLSHLSVRDIRIKRSMLTSKLTRVLFPERVEAIVAFPAPFVLRGVLTVLRPLMPADVTQRMKIFGGKKAANKFFLSRGMTNAQLPTSLGGEREVLWQRDPSDIVLASLVEDEPNARRSKRRSKASVRRPSTRQSAARLSAKSSTRRSKCDSKRASKERRSSKRESTRTKSASTLPSSESSVRGFP
jgi:hypothetical protein